MICINLQSSFIKNEILREIIEFLLTSQRKEKLHSPIEYSRGHRPITEKMPFLEWGNNY